MTALLMTALVNCYAQKTSTAEKAINEIVRKHEQSTGVSCMTVSKGNGLGMIKTVFNKEFGKDFMKGVTSITIIEYSDASKETCASLHKDLDGILSVLEEFDISKEKQFTDNDFIRCFASSTDSDRISDFVIALENDTSKTILYMAGDIIIEQ